MFSSNCYPSQALIQRLAAQPVFTTAEVAALSGISRQLANIWIIRRIVDIGAPTQGRRLLSLRNLLHIAVMARVSNSHGISAAAATLIGSSGADAIIREWFQAAGDFDRQASQAIDIQSEFDKRGGYFLMPRPLRALDEAERRLSDSHILCFPADLTVDSAVHGYAPSVPIGDVLSGTGSPVFMIDLAPICQGILKPAARILQQRVTIDQAGIPPEVLEQWKCEGVPAELIPDTKQTTIN